MGRHQRPDDGQLLRGEVGLVTLGLAERVGHHDVDVVEPERGEPFEPRRGFFGAAPQVEVLVFRKRPRRRGI